jgi:hypothetical protein
MTVFCSIESKAGREMWSYPQKVDKGLSYIIELFIAFRKDRKRINQARRNIVASNANGNHPRDDEIVTMTRWDNKEEKWAKNIFPKVGKGEKQKKGLP